MPHWTRPGATYFVTFRLADAIPQPVLQAHREELEERLQILRRARGRSLTEDEEREERRKQNGRVERYLDSGHGRCLLNDPRAAEIVQNALFHFHNGRYHLDAWCVMPNHAHVLVTPRDEHRLRDILHSWKSFTTHEINRLLERHGTLWQSEYFDHLVRSEAYRTKFVDYILQNPPKAGLHDWPWVGTR